jgi:hypothetical protein
VKERTATCCCGEVSITLQGEPERVIRCHCLYCQRRTGNVFQVSAWFLEDQIVSRTGKVRVYNDSENNQGIDYTFCIRCGSTVYWPIKPISGLYGVAVGCFADADFPQPNFELNDKYRHSWVQELHIDDSYDEWAPPEKMVLNR